MTILQEPPPLFLILNTAVADAAHGGDDRVVVALLQAM